MILWILLLSFQRVFPESSDDPDVRVRTCEPENKEMDLSGLLWIPKSGFKYESLENIFRAFRALLPSLERKTPTNRWALPGRRGASPDLPG